MYGKKTISQSLLDAVNSVTQQDVQQEGWDDMMKSVKDKSGPQPNGGSGIKQGTRYGGGKQKDDEREKETERLEKKKTKSESMEFKDRLIESLKGKQKKIDKNHNNKIDAQDFAILRAQKNEEVGVLDEGKMDRMSLTHLWHAHATHSYHADQGYGHGSGSMERNQHAATAIENHVRKHHGNKVADDMVHHSDLHVSDAEYAGAEDSKRIHKEAEKLRKKHGIEGDLYGHHTESVKESLEEAEETKSLTVDTLAGPKKAPKGFQKDNEHVSAKVPLKTEEAHEDAKEDEKLDKAILRKMVKKSALKNEETLEERDEGKPGKMFKVIAAKAAKEYGSQEAGNRVAGEIRKKVLAKEDKRPESDTVPFVTDEPQSPKERLRSALGKVKTEMKKSW